MPRLLPCLIAMLLLAPIGAQADSWRHDRRDHRHDERRYDDRRFDGRFDNDRRFERRFHNDRLDRRFHDRRFDRPYTYRNDGRTVILGKQAPWRGHRGWRDFESRRFDRFSPGSNAFDRRGAHVYERRHHSKRLHHPQMRHHGPGRGGAHRHRR